MDVFSDRQQFIWTRSRVLSDYLYASELDAFRGRCQEFVFKPVYSRFASETLIKPTAAQLDQIGVSEHRPWIAQKFIEGQEYSTYSIARQGKLLAHCTYQSRFRAGVGSGICFHPLSNPAITEFTKNFVQEHCFTGQLGFDFIVDTHQQVWVLEGNPRATSGLHLIDNDAQFIDAIKGKPVKQLIEPDRVDTRQIFAAMLFFGFQDAIRKREFGSYLRQLLTSKDVVFRGSDPLPFLALPLTLGELIWVAIRERMNIQQATTFDIEWNGEPL